MIYHLLLMIYRFATYDLPTPPILQKEAFRNKKKVDHKLPVFAPKEPKVDHR